MPILQRGGALKGVNAEIKHTQNQLKDVEKLLKLDPGNTELLPASAAVTALGIAAVKTASNFDSSMSGVAGNL